MVRERILPLTLPLETRQRAEDKPLQRPMLLLEDPLNNIDNIHASLHLDGVGALPGGTVRDLGERTIGLEKGAPKIRHGEYHMSAAKGGDESVGLVHVCLDERDAFGSLGFSSVARC